MIAIFVGAFLTALSGALMPGPVLTVTIAEAARRGPGAGPLVVLGHAVLELALVCVLAVGLGRFLGRPAVFAAIGLAGGAALLIMAASMVRASTALPPADAAANPPAASSLRPVGLGAAASLANPYWTLWWATAGLAILSNALPYGLAGVALFFAGHISADFAWYALVAAAVSRGRTLMTSRSYRALIVSCAIALAGLGIYFICSGAQRLQA